MRNSLLVTVHKDATNFEGDRVGVALIGGAVSRRTDRRVEEEKEGGPVAESAISVHSVEHAH